MGISIKNEIDTETEEERKKRTLNMGRRQTARRKDAPSYGLTVTRGYSPHEVATPRSSG